MGLSKRARQIEPSGTQAMTQRIRDLKRQGKNVLAFSSGEPDFPTPDNIKRAAVAALDANFTRYTAMHGVQELRQAICDRHRAAEPERPVLVPFQS